MSRSDELTPGAYRVEMTIVRDFEISEEDLPQTENDALDWCREAGECVDWEVEKVG